MHACINPACYRWGTGFPEFVRVSQDAGFRSVEVSIQQAAALAADLGGLPALASWFTDRGVAVEQFSGIIPAGPVLPAPLLIDDAFTATLPGLTHRLDVAAALGCHRAAVVVNPRTDLSPHRSSDTALSRLQLLATRARPYGITLSVEFITHDLGVVAEMCSSVVVMYLGQVIEQASVAEIFERPLHPYTRGLLRSVPEMSTDRTRPLHAIPGVVPPLTRVPAGCRFAGRCPFAVDMCREELPELRDFGAGHQTRCHRAHEIDAGRLVEQVPDV